MASRFETRGAAALLTMRVTDLIPGMNAIAFTRGSALSRASRRMKPPNQKGP
jgi:hypothetical protein